MSTTKEDVPEQAKRSILEVVEWLEKKTGKEFTWHNSHLGIPCIEGESYPPVEVLVFLNTDMRTLTRSFKVRIRHRQHTHQDGDTVDASMDFIEQMIWAIKLGRDLAPCERHTWNVEEYRQFEDDMRNKYREENEA